MPIDPALLEPFWASETMHKEPLFFIDDGRGEASAALLFRPDDVITLTSATEEIAFDQGLDYMVDVAAGRILRPSGSRIPVTRRQEIAALSNAPDDAFHCRQVAVTYRHSPGQWRGDVPAFAGDRLSRTAERLRRKEPLTLCLTGDSISEGYNASGFIGVAPHQPAFGSLVASALERASGSAIAFHNFAVAGWTADNGVYDAERVTAPTPDLVIVAYGMNDAGYADAAHYAANIETIMANVRVAVPDAEFLLVSPMLPNPEWDYPVAARFAAYRDALTRLSGSGSGTALADMTAMWTELLRRKSWFDLAGNGFNHPNDFGHRLYAQVILAVLGAARV